MTTTEVVQCIVNKLNGENIKYYFDGAGNIVATNRESSEFVVISFMNPEISGEILCEILSTEQEEEFCYNLDDVVNVLKRNLEK